ncbi:glycosyltransferase family 2 protein [Dietzia sp. DQ11-71]|nr:glycosyltransferase family 2 protein [Dietzia sp. DQ11-71]MBB1017021.1 glycosyltransferase family 2 protein [Dietzia sp. DQ11-71]
MNVGIAIVYFEGIDEFRETLDSIPFELAKIAVCDASVKSEARALVDMREDAIWLDCSRNGGYAWAVNKGIGQLLGDIDHPCDVVIISNPDVVYSESSLRELVANVTRLGGVHFPLQTDCSGSTLGHSLLRGLSRWTIVANWLVPDSFRQNTLRTELLTAAVRRREPVRMPASLSGNGACIAVDRSAWEAIGGFNDGFFLFAEDKTFTYRAHSLEIPVYLAGNASVVHEGGFKSRGMSEFQLIEYIASERIAWKSMWKTPLMYLYVAQLLGLSLRMISSFSNSVPTMREVYKKVLVKSARNRLCEGDLRGADGVRVSTLSALDEKERR